jgi:glutamate-ammonia-ligase adenylyltransferase
VRNDADAAHTVLTIEGPDTPGFLYALANALSVAGYYIARMTVETIGARARDVLHITDAAGGRVEGARRERELRAATVLVKHFTHLLPLSPDPQRALSHLRGFLARLFAEEDWPARLASVDRPEVLTALARLLGVSDALWEDLLRLQYEDLFPVLADVEALAEPRTRADLDRALADLLVSAPDPAAARERLNAFKDREMFRVDMRHILGQTAEFGAFSAELGDVAEAVLSAALGLAYGALGPPPGPPVALALVGLGKLGGREMGYASDVELLFVYEDTQAPTRPQVAEFHERLVAEFLATIRSRRAGIFRIDLRLRPYGAAGSLAVSLEAFRRYYGPEGPAWPYERQALVKARAIAGDAALGARVEALRDEIVYGGAAFDAVAMRAMRERQLRHLVPGGVLNSKYSSGGLVDVEYLVQGLQMRHGAAHPDVRRVNTLEALDALTAVGALDRAQHDDLRAAYILLRRVIDALRIVRGNADDLALPPEGDEEWLYLARRMGNGEALARGQDAAAHLRRRLSESMARVAALAGELLGA